MIERKIKIKNKLGLHARPAAVFVKTASKFKSDISLIKDGQQVNGKSIMGVLMLAAEKGSEVTLRIDGEDEIAAMETLLQLFENKFNEE